LHEIHPSAEPLQFAGQGRRFVYGDGARLGSQVLTAPTAQSLYNGSTQTASHHLRKIDVHVPHGGRVADRLTTPILSRKIIEARLAGRPVVHF